jgi:hypothetical protein
MRSGLGYTTLPPPEVVGVGAPALKSAPLLSLSALAPRCTDVVFEAPIAADGPSKIPAEP